MWSRGSFWCRRRCWHELKRVVSPGHCELTLGFGCVGNHLKPLSSIAMKAHALLWPNRACDPVKESLIELGAPFIQSAWTGDRAESWYLEFLAVDPGSQGKGVGKVLVQWGLDQAEREGVCASVISAEGKDGFYMKCGFDVVDGYAGMGEGNPLGGVPGGNMLWRMPK